MIAGAGSQYSLYSKWDETSIVQTVAVGFYAIAGYPEQGNSKTGDKRRKSHPTTEKAHVQNTLPGMP
jgi:hypothetical protein